MMRAIYSFESGSDYSFFLFSLENKFPEIIFSEINFYSIEPDLFLAKGIIEFALEIKLTFHKVINFCKQRIVRCAYEVFKKNELLYFHDPQEHLEDSNLEPIFPHYKHLQPNIKRNRQPAAGISFIEPNLQFLIQEIIDQFL